jgi:hypothetical protein
MMIRAFFLDVLVHIEQHFAFWRLIELLNHYYGHAASTQRSIRGLPMCSSANPYEDLQNHGYESPSLKAQLGGLTPRRDVPSRECSG